MLLSFRFKNFRSFRDEQEFSMVASNLKGPTEPLIETGRKDLKVLPVAAVYGPNASGKTNFLNALHFMARAVRDSYRSWTPGGSIPIERFGLDPDMASEPARFEVDMLIERVRFHYGFSLVAAGVLEEWLYAFPEGRRQVWFTRGLSDEAEYFRFGKNLAGPNATIRSLTRKNSLFLSAAAQNNHPQVSPVYLWVTENLKFIHGSRSTVLRSSARYLSAPELRKPLLRLMAAADLGISNIAFEEESESDVRQLLKAFVTLHEAAPGRPNRPKVEFSYPGVPKITFSHSVGQGKPEVMFGIEEESEGTRALLALAGPIFRCLERGGVLLIDELEASLHPLLARELIRLFSRPESNPRGAQLIFNTHDTNLLDPELLRRDQIWFCEKDGTGASRLYPLSDFRPRRMENVERGYLQGRYGAIPFLGDLDLSVSESKE